MLRFSALALVLFTIVIPVSGQQAPVPVKLQEARTALLVNEGTWIRVFDKFYSDFEKWGRFTIVQDRNQADIVVVLSGTPGESGAGVAVGATGVPTVVVGGSDPKYFLRITDRRDGSVLWSDVAYASFLLSNSAKKLVANLRERIGARAAPQRTQEAGNTVAMPRAAQTSDIHCRAEQGDAEAQYVLGVSYNTGKDTTQDYGAAARWFRKAAEQGHTPAMYSLGLLYQTGLGVPQDYVEAHKWLNLATSRASTDQQLTFASARDAVTKLMTPEQLADAQKRAREWLDAVESKKR